MFCAKLWPSIRLVVTRVKLSSAARADFVVIRKYSIEQFSADVADRYFTGFNELFDLLRRHPKAGLPEPNLGKGIRKITHRQHRIIYHVQDDVVVIIRIIHHAMDVKRALKKAKQ